MVAPAEPVARPHQPVAPIEVTLHEEELRVGVVRAPYRRVRFRKRVVTEVRTVEVEVRSEVLDIDWIDADGIPSDSDTANHVGEAAAGQDRLQFVLWGEEPVVTLTRVPKEMVTATRFSVAGTCDINEELRTERVDVQGDRVEGDRQAPS